MSKETNRARAKSVSSDNKVKKSRRRTVAQKPTQRATKKAKGGGFKTTKLNVSGNLVHTGAKVDNILQYMTYASTDDTPYLMSTYDRYMALNKDGIYNSIMSRVNSDIETRDDEVFKVLVKTIREEESKRFSKSELSKVVNSGGETGIESFIEQMNNFNYNGKSLENTVMKSLTPITRASFKFIDDYTKSPEFMENVEKLLKGEIEIDVFKSGNSTSTKYSMKGEGELKELFDALDTISTMLSSKSEFYEGDIKTVSNTISFAATVAAKAKAESNKSGLSDEQFSYLISKIRQAVESVNNSSEEGFKFTKNAWSFGHMTEIVTMDALNQFMDIWKLKMKFEGDVDEEIADLVELQIASGKNDAIHKSVDLFLETQAGKFGFDIKNVGEKSMKERGIIYTSSVNMDLGQEMKNLLSKDSALSPSVRSLYAGYIMNRSAHTGYDLKPKDREALLANYFSNESNVKKKFEIAELEEKNGYPMFAVVNGVVMRFSDILTQFGKAENFTDTKPFNLSSPVDVGGARLYKAKIKRSQELGGGQVRKVPGFAAQVPEAVEAARLVENSYKSGKKSPVQFKITKK